MTKKSTATMLLEIANDIYDLGCVSEQRGINGDDDRVAVYTFATPKGSPNERRPLHEIRADIAAVYQLTNGNVPNASALADAMTVLEGQARSKEPVAAGKGDLAALLGAKATATDLVEMVHAKFVLGVSATGEAYAVPIAGPNVARLLRGGRRSLRAEVARLFFEEKKATANAQALADALLVVEGEAQRCEPTEVVLRVGRTVDGRLALDLGRDDGLAVLIGPYGWEITPSPVLFWRTNATLPLPVPVIGGDLQVLRDLLNVTDDDWPLILAWLVAALMADIPHPALLIRGEHGTAKSSAARLLTSLLDRCASQLRTAPRDVEDWCVAAAGSWITCLDNASDIQPWLSDAICRAVTGDGLLRRQLYTDSDVSVLAFRRVIALTSVDPGRLAGDLADRLLTVELERIPEGSRKGEEELSEEWTKAHPLVLGALLDLTVATLQKLSTVRRSGLPRMADFARVVLAVDQVLGTDGYRTYREQSRAANEQVVDSDSVAIAIRERIDGSWQGTASELLVLLTGEKPAKDWPTTPQGMGARLVRTAPSLRAIGWTVDQLTRKDKKGSRGWHIDAPVEEVPAGTSDTPTSSETLFDLRERADNQADNHGPADNHVPPDGQSVSAGQTMSGIADDHAGTSSTEPMWQPNDDDPDDDDDCPICGRDLDDAAHLADCEGES